MRVIQPACQRVCLISHTSVGLHIIWLHVVDADHRGSACCGGSGCGCDCVCCCVQQEASRSQLQHIQDPCSRFVLWVEGACADSMFILCAGAAEFSNPLYDTSYPGGSDSRPSYASAYDNPSSGVIANPAYATLPGAGGYSEPASRGGYVEPAVRGGYSEPAVRGGYSEPSYVGAPSLSGEYMETMEPDTIA